MQCRWNLEQVKIGYSFSFQSTVWGFRPCLKANGCECSKFLSFLFVILWLLPFIFSSLECYTEFLGYLIYYELRTAGIYDSNLELLGSRMVWTRWAMRRSAWFVDMLVLMSGVLFYCVLVVYGACNAESYWITCVCVCVCVCQGIRTSELLVRWVVLN